VQEVDWTRPTAFVLGNEREGVSDTAVALADATAIIPMAGEEGGPGVRARQSTGAGGVGASLGPGWSGCFEPQADATPHLPVIGYKGLVHQQSSVLALALGAGGLAWCSLWQQHVSTLVGLMVADCDIGILTCCLTAFLAVQGLLRASTYL
jgi:hypothetical protein